MSYEERIRCKKLLDKVITAEAAADMIKDGMSVGTSGFTPFRLSQGDPLGVSGKGKKRRPLKN